MSRDVFDVELGLAISAENGDRQVYILSGTAVPDGTSGKQQEAPIGSLYLRSGTGELYQKIANAGAPADYELNGAASAQIGNWRPERVVLLTNDTQAPGVRDVVASPFTDDDGAAVPLAAFVVGKYIIADADGTPSLLEITNVTGNNVTFAAAATAPVADDAWLVSYYLPDSPDNQEAEAIVVFNGTVMVKVSDVNWNIADGINLASGYTAQNGSITNADTVNSAIEKLDGNQQDLISLSGVAQGSTTLGAFSTPGSFLLVSASLTIKSALQVIADFLFGIKVTNTTGVQSSTVVDSLPHASYKRVQWIVDVFETATPANREGFVIDALTDGTSVDDTKYSKLKLGSNIAAASVVAINGANLELSISATPSCTVNVRRITVV